MSVRAKHVFFAAFGLLTLFVFYLYETPFPDSRPPVWQHVEPVKWLLLLPHGVAGALALTVGGWLRRRLRKVGSDGPHAIDSRGARAYVFNPQFR